MSACSSSIGSPVGVTFDLLFFATRGVDATEAVLAAAEARWRKSTAARERFTPERDMRESSGKKGTGMVRRVNRDEAEQFELKLSSSHMRVSRHASCLLTHASCSRC